MGEVLILANSSSGIYDFRRELIQALIKKGYEVATSNPDQDKTAELEKIGCKVIKTKIDRRGVNPIHDLALLSRYRRIIKAEKPELVITYTIKPNIYGGLICRALGVPYAANITGLGTAFERDGFVKKLVTLMYKVALKRARVVYFENSANRQIFTDAGIIEANKTKVLNGAGVNLDHFKYTDYPHEDDGFKFLFVGRLMKEKGVDELLESMKKLVNEGIQCSLDILGYYEENYKGKLDEAVNEGWLRYHGNQPDVRPFIAACDCFVLPSYHEGMANTNLECASSGRPIITSNIPGCKEAVVDGSGLLCEPKNVDSLYEAMKAMYSLSMEERKQMGLKGRKHMEDQFDKKDIVQKTIKELFPLEQ